MAKDDLVWEHIAKHMTSTGIAVYENITQSRLEARTSCCNAMISFIGGWQCYNCRKKVENGPETMVGSSLYYLERNILSANNARTVEEWIFEWTGLEVEVVVR